LDLADPRRIEPVGRLVEDHQLGLRQQRRRHAQPLFHSQRVGTDQIISAVAQLHLLKHLVDPCAIKPPQTGQHLKVAPARQRWVERRRLDQRPDPRKVRARHITDGGWHTVRHDLLWALSGKEHEMFKNILVGVDRHDRGRDAIALSKTLLDAGGQLTLAHVYSGEPHTWLGSPPEHDLDGRARIAELLETASKEASVHAALRWHESPSVGRGLHELCEATDADLLVVGSSRRSLLGRVLLGDDTHAALNGAPCAIAIAPAGYAERPAAIREIGVAYNGSPESEHALAVARTLAGEHNAKLSALEAVSLPAYALVGGGTPVADAINRLVEDARERIAALGGVEPHAVYGIPAEELSPYSASLDLLVVGSRGYGPVGRLVHGSISQQLARTARCPLLVLTRAAV
jgi:nucleotide-binding universal stress UspA family protein